MPQISPMKWLLLNALTQSSILQIISFSSVNKNYTLEPSHIKLMVKKLCWEW